MRESHYNWTFKSDNQESDLLVPELERLNKQPVLSSFLWNRGIQDKKEIESFFNPKIADLHDPYLLNDMDKAIKRIQEAVEKGERILVYGDYDADGITSTTVMKEAIELIGGDVSYYIPNRFTDGYGPNLDVYKRMIDEGIQLIITVDNGVSGHKAIEYATNQKIDVIVTDHHEIPETLPNAFAIIHPRHPNSEYPFKDLAGVGVSFKVATALLGEVPVESLDLVAIGTIADLVSLTGENRTLSKIGLDILKQTERIGLQMIAKEAQIDLLKANEETVGFNVAPRLNAIGRLGDATQGVTLLSTFDEDEALQLAKMIQTTNTKRQDIVKKIAAEAIEMADRKKEDELLFLVGKNWHEGVLGIVASQVVQKTGKPTIALRLDEETGILKGSGRSIESIDLFKTLTTVKEKLQSFGGHHMAIGLSLEEKYLVEIKEKVNDYLLENRQTRPPKIELLIDKQVSLEEVNVKYIETLSQLAPFGNGNPSPQFLINGAKAINFKRSGTEGTHLKGQLSENGSILDCIAFNQGDDVTEFTGEEQIAFVGQLSINEWNGHRKPQLMLTDFQVEGCQIFDLRGKKGNLVNLATKKRAYLIFNSTYRPEIDLLDAPVFWVNKEQSIDYKQLNEYQEIVIQDCPYDLKSAKEVFSGLKVERIYLRIDVKEEHYLKGLPSREEFSRLFKLIATHSSLDIRHKLDQIANYLKIERNRLIFMIQVFFDLGFVTIEDGLMKKVANPKNRALQESKIYQDYENKIEMEKLFLYSDIKDIKKWILNQEEIK